MPTITKPQKTMLNVKIDTELKKKAQKLARGFGLPLSTIVARKLEEFINNEKITFEKPLIPNAKTAKIIREAEKDIAKGEIGLTYNSVEDFMNALSKS